MAASFQADQAPAHPTLMHRTAHLFSPHQTHHSADWRERCPGTRRAGRPAEDPGQKTGGNGGQSPSTSAHTESLRATPNSPTPISDDLCPSCPAGPLEGGTHAGGGSQDRAPVTSSFPAPGSGSGRSWDESPLTGRLCGTAAMTTATSHKAGLWPGAGAEVWGQGRYQRGSILAEIWGEGRQQLGVHKGHGPGEAVQGHVWVTPYPPDLRALDLFHQPSTPLFTDSGPTWGRRRWHLMCPLSPVE